MPPGKRKKAMEERRPWPRRTGPCRRTSPRRQRRAQRDQQDLQQIVALRVARARIGQIRKARPKPLHTAAHRHHRVEPASAQRVGKKFYKFLDAIPLPAPQRGQPGGRRADGGGHQGGRDHPAASREGESAGLEIVVGERRVKGAIANDLAMITVLVAEGSIGDQAMAAIIENVVRAPLLPVDQWRAIDRLEAAGWNVEAISATLALPTRTIRKLKLLASIHPPMLEHIAQGVMPNELDLRTIANAPLDEQAAVWKRRKPKKGEPVIWYEIGRALQKQRMPAKNAKFDDELAQAFKIVWWRIVRAGRRGQVAIPPGSRNSRRPAGVARTAVCPRTASSCHSTSGVSPSCRPRHSGSMARSSARPTR